MNAELYAITQAGYRTITQGMALAAGETAVASLPQSLLDRIAADQARSDRAQRLRETDWTQMPDAQLTAAQKSAMAAYRQTLRDMPAQPGWPNIPWPAIPGLGEGAAGGGNAPLG